MNKAIKKFKEGALLPGEYLTLFINSLLLVFVYFVGVGLTFLVAKIKGKSFLQLVINKRKKSYWQDLNLKKEKMENYYRQF